ncbi:hypothetical protein B0I35DRAFT_439977 [Stachybotrys elegans]|uniref:Uncharacterized protein n=1 Tax=Stachybotrys elegans TaxID=80388 RepID=A0A8K0SM13_9HYPO|nr:hypothetical protein B0I35DRAFT_439977 [Stachybotrys elegans]
MGLVDAKNKVPEYQRFYQQAYKAHTRVWQINPRSRFLVTPFTFVMWATFGGSYTLEFRPGHHGLTYSSFPLLCWPQGRRIQHLVWQELSERLCLDWGLQVASDGDEAGCLTSGPFTYT